MDHLLHGVAESDTGAADGGAESDKERVEALAQFQEKAIRHALTLPGLQRLVYSTCSVHSRENEEVVAAVLGEARERGFELAEALPGWPRRGLPVVEGHEKLVSGGEGTLVAGWELWTEAYSAAVWDLRLSYSFTFLVMMTLHLSTNSGLHIYQARTDMIEDGTDGFFLAVFERTGPGSGKGKGGSDGTDGATGQGKKGKKRAKAGGDDGFAKKAEVPAEAAPARTSGQKKRRKEGGA